MTDTITLPRATVQQALEALENTSPLGFHMESDKKFFAAIAALREALQEDALQKLSDLHQEMEQPAQEPVLFIHPDTFAMNASHVGAWKPGHELPGYIPLYAAPQPAKRDPLTDEEIEDAYGAAAVADEVRCPECGYLTKHTEHIGCLRKQLSAINAFEQRNFAIVNTDKAPQPVQRKPLTDEEIHDCFQQGHKDKATQRRMITRAIEAKLKEKNA